MLIWTARSMGCELLALAPLTMTVSFRHMVLLHSLLAMTALVHVPAATIQIMAVNKDISASSVHIPLLGLILLEALAVPAVFSYMAEKLARLLFLERLRRGGMHG